jgi:hypothetical protein
LIKITAITATTALQAFNKARRMETRERLSDHMVTYKDWQKLLGGVKVKLFVVTVIAVTVTDATVISVGTATGCTAVQQ